MWVKSRLYPSPHGQMQLLPHPSPSSNEHKSSERRAAFFSPITQTLLYLRLGITRHHSSGGSCNADPQVLTHKPQIQKFWKPKHFLHSFVSKTGPAWRLFIARAFPPWDIHILLQEEGGV